MAAVSKPSSRTIRKHSAKITHWNPENGCSLSRVCTLTPVAAASFWTDVMTCLFHCLSAWILWLANMFLVLAYDTEYAMVDRDDDLRIGMKTDRKSVV